MSAYSYQDHFSQHIHTRIKHMSAYSYQDHFSQHIHTRMKHMSAYSYHDHFSQHIHIRIKHMSAYSYQDQDARIHAQTCLAPFQCQSQLLKALCEYCCVLYVNVIACVACVLCHMFALRCFVRVFLPITSLCCLSL